jgi:hypothetical protein
MSRGSKITILIVVGLIVIGLIAYFVLAPVFFGNQPPAAKNVNTNKNVGTVRPAVNKPVVAPPVNVPLPPAEVAPATVQASAARTVALTFAERAATYTNQNNLANLADLESMSTPAVWKYIMGDYRSGLIKSMPDAKSYYAVTATALNASLVPNSDTEVAAAVQMQRVESGSVTKTSYATMDLVLKKVNGVWLIARFDWAK